MKQIVARAQKSPTGWLLLCLAFGGIGALIGALLSWSAKWPLPVALGIGAALGILLATRVLKQRPKIQSLAGPEVDLGSWRTDQVVLRHMNLADTEADAVAKTIDEEVIRAMGWSDQDVEGIVSMSRDPLLMAQRGFIMVTEPGREDHVLGVVSITRIPGQAAEAGLGLWMAPEARGRGLGPAAIRLAAEMCWQSNVAVLTLGTTAENTSMQRCYLAAGADLFDTCENELPDGRIVDASWYRIHNPHA